MNVKYLTPEGKKVLVEKLDYYKKVLRPEVVKKIGVARSFGDLKENSEYDAAKDEQAVLESQIKDMEDTLLNAVIIKKERLDCSKVEVGVKVSLYDEDFDEEVQYAIVGTEESDPKNFSISNESPLGSSLLGKKVGEKVVVSTPNGKCEYKILAITI